MTKRRRCVHAIGLLILALYVQTCAADWRDALRSGAAAAAQSAADELKRQQELERQKELLRLQMELEAQRFRQQQEIEEQKRRQQQTINENRERAVRESERPKQVAAEDAKRKQAEIEKRNAASTGTGFFITPNGYLITNAHVVNEYEIVKIKDQTGKSFDATVIAIDKQRDLALLKVSGTFPTLRIDQVGRPVKGQRVVTIGYPQISIQGSESKVTDGVVSSLSGIRNNDDWIQISVPIQGGNSGGPLINEHGTVIGVVVATVNAQKFLSVTGNLPQNINFAIKAKVVLSFLAEQQIRNTGNTNKKDSIEAVDRATALVIAMHGEPISVPEQKAPPVPKTTVTTETEYQKQNRKLVASIYPDYQEVFADPGFMTWRKTLPEARRQELAATWEASTVIRAISEYKETKKINAGPLQNSQTAAVSENLRLGKLSYDRMEYTAALAQFRKAADGESANARTYIGYMYQTGLGVIKDESAAVGWYRIAAEQGFAQAQHNLASMYVGGQGVGRVDAREAVRWYRKAADQGFANSQNVLGVMYASGEGVTKDDIEAAKWFRKAAEQGHANAQKNIASFYANGRLEITDDDEAVRWYRKAAEQSGRTTNIF